MNALSNPAAIAAVANSKQGQQVISQAMNAAKVALIVGGSVLAINYAWKKYKDYRADKYARQNVGNPDLLAAAVIYNSFTRFEFPGYLGWILPSFEVSTDETALNNIASEITNIKAVSDAYKILFDRNLFTDAQKGLDTEELQTFWNLINSPQVNNETNIYPIGSKLYVAQRNGITVNMATQNQNGKWVGTSDLYRKLKRNELVGEVIAQGKVTQAMITDQNDTNLIGQNYYIVKEVRFNQCFTNCEIGVVVQQQVTDKQV